MEVEEVIKEARDAMTVRRVYGEPYDRDGSTIIPAAAVRGGAGGGSGEGTGPQGEGGKEGGSGFGLSRGRWAPSCCVRATGSGSPR
jgi:uncharacterized spore protein YtfJ